MSKSYGNAISLCFTEEETAKLIKKSQTDSERFITYDKENRPGVSALLTTAALCTGRSEEEIAAEIGNDGSGALKKYVTESVNEFAPVFASVACSWPVTWTTSRMCCTRATAVPTRSRTPLRVIGKKVCPEPNRNPCDRAACMQVIPLHSSAPAPHRFIFFASFGSCSIKLSNQDVRRHFLQDLFRACTGFKVHIAPPERRLDAPRQPQSPMLSQHVADLGVHAAFDPVRSRRNRSSLEQAFVEIGE